MSGRVVLSILVAAALASCSTESTTSAGTAATAGGGGGDAKGGVTISCETPSVVITLVGVPISSTRACLETDQPTLLEMCETLGEEANFGEWVPQCFRRLADGVDFWFVHPYVLRAVSSGWERCSPPVDTNAWFKTPPPCFTECEEQTLDKPPQVTFSMCSASSTKESFDCGLAESSFDDNCCRRKNCSTNADCAANEQCNTIAAVLAFMHCWPGDLESCNCGGSLGGPPESFCFPR